MNMNVVIRNARNEKMFEASCEVFTVRLNASPNSKWQRLESEIKRAIGPKFEERRKAGMCVCNTKVTLELHSRDTLFDLGSFGANCHRFRATLAELGMKGATFNVAHFHDTDSFIDATVSFKNVSPLELYRTE